MVLIGAQIPELLKRVQDVKKMTFRTGCERLSNAFRTPFTQRRKKDMFLERLERVRTRPNAFERFREFLNGLSIKKLLIGL